jgi:hypothetical protein
MGRKLGSRPFYKAIPYTERNWQIIGRGTSTGSGDDFGFILKQRKPLAVTNSFSAKYESRCAYCERRIEMGTTICRALFHDGNEFYVHKDCCREKPKAF